LVATLAVRGRILEAALKLRQKHFVIDGEVVVLDKDGISDFDALSSRKRRSRRARLRLRSESGS
jgi:ATP-dependent DNA ligase